MISWMWSDSMCIWRKREAPILDCVLFIMRKQDRFLFLRINKCTTASAVEPEGMFSRLWCSMKTLLSGRQWKPWRTGQVLPCQSRNILPHRRERQIKNSGCWRSTKRQPDIFIHYCGMTVENMHSLISRKENCLRRPWKSLVWDIRISTVMTYTGISVPKGMRMRS